jgi:hypothetical protein
MAIILDEAGASILDEAGAVITDEAGGAGSASPAVGVLTLAFVLFSASIDTGIPAAETISTWLQGEFQKTIYEPQRTFFIGTSDYSDRVVKWPTIRRTANDVKSAKIKVSLANNDGALNNFYDATYSLVNTVSVHLGDTHPTSGWEDLDLFTGYMSGVKYSNMQCVVEARDRLFDFTQKVIGDTNSVVEIPASGGIIPSELAWIICTCYGELSTVQNTSNPDIHWDDFNEWAEQFSANAIEIHGRYDGMKASKALREMAEYTDSSVVIEGDGKIHFKKFNEVSSQDYTWDYDKIIKLDVDVNKRRLVNKQFVAWDYKVESDYYAGNVFAQDAISVNTFGLYEETLERDSVWYVDSVSALNTAQRSVALFSDPPKYFKLTTGLDGIWREIGDTARFVDSFYNVTSGAGWRIVEREINLHDGLTKIDLDEATVLDAFYLDVSTLDGVHYLL